MPYNTYTHKGGCRLDRSATRSMDAVVAALYPDEQYAEAHKKYLYFCSAEPESGKLVFSKTLEEHNKAVSYYRQYWEEYDKSRGLN
ncbi:MAG: endolytic transglycosylase MltG [Christensenellales bacterium]